jgi:hypothetical protein
MGGEKKKNSNLRGFPPYNLRDLAVGKSGIGTDLDNKG